MTNVAFRFPVKESFYRFPLTELPYWETLRLQRHLWLSVKTTSERIPPQSSATGPKWRKMALSRDFRYEYVRVLRKRNCTSIFRLQNSHRDRRCISLDILCPSLNVPLNESTFGFSNEALMERLARFLCYITSRVPSNVALPRRAYKEEEALLSESSSSLSQSPR